MTTDPNRAQGPDRRVAWLWMALILIGAVAVRWWLVLGDRIVWGDEPFYLWLGRNWAVGNGYQFVGHADVHHGPLFPMVAGLLYRVVGDLTVASNVIYVTAGALLVLPIYALGREFYNERVGLYAAALTAVFPALTVSILNWGTLTEPLYMLLVYLGLWLGVRMLSPLWHAKDEAAPWWFSGLTGLSMGLAYLVRPEAVNYVAVLGLFFLWMLLTQSRWRKISFWLSGILFGLGFALAFLPYAYYVFLQTGQWMVSEKIGVAYLTGIGLAYGDTAAFDRSTWGLDATGLETFFFSSESYTVSMLRLVLDDPRTFAIVLYLNAKTFVRVLIDATVLPYAALPVVTLGLFGRSWSGRRLCQELFLIASMLPVAGFLLFFIQARYLVPVIPVFILWIAAGLDLIGDWGVATAAKLGSSSSSWRGFWTMAPLVVALLCLGAAYPAVTAKVQNVGSVRVEHKQLGESMASLVDESTVIMCRYPAIAYHAGASWTPTPNAALADVARYAASKGADYFVIDQAELRYRPQFRQLYDERLVPEWLEVVQVGQQGDDLTVLRIVQNAEEE